MHHIDDMRCSIESRLMSRMDEMGQFFETKVDTLFDALNTKINLIVEQIRDIPSRGKFEDLTPFDIHKQAAELGISDILVTSDD